MKKTNMPKFKKFDVLDHVTDEEYALCYLWAASREQEEMDTQDRVRDAWDVVNQASTRHGFPITPAIRAAYATARAEAAAHPGTPSKPTRTPATRTRAKTGTAKPEPAMA